MNNTKNQLKYFLIATYFFALIYMLFLSPFEVSDEREHFFRSIGGIFYTENYFIKKIFIDMCNSTYYDCAKSLYKLILESFSKDKYLSNEISTAELLNIKGYLFTSYIYQKFITYLLINFIEDPIQVYFFGKLIILTINFIIIFYLINLIKNLSIQLYLIFIINFPLSLMLLGSYSQDMLLIMVTLFLIYFLSIKFSYYRFITINFLILILSIGKIPYGFFFFIPFLIIYENKKFALNYYLITIIFILMFLTINIINLNSYDLIKKPNITYIEHINFIRQNFLIFPFLILKNFITNSWTYIQQGVGYYSPGNIFNNPWNIIIYPYLFVFLFIFFLLFLKSYSKKTLTFLIFFIFSILFLTIIHWFGFSYPSEIVNIVMLDGRYFLINIFLFGYYYYYSSLKQQYSINKFRRFIINIILILQITNTINIVSNKL